MPATRPIVRLSSPSEIVALVPVLCGFVPRESLVAVSLQGVRHRVGLTMRFDLDWCDGQPHASQEIADRLGVDQATRALLVLFSETPDDDQRARGPLVEQVQGHCAQRGIEVSEALLVRSGRWTSYLCTGRVCCPDEGTPIEFEPSPALQLVAAERVLAGRAVLGSREELVRSVAPPVLLAAVVARQELDRAEVVWWNDYCRLGRDALFAQSIAAARSAMSRAMTPAGVTLVEAAGLAVAVQDVRVRDEVATWALRQRDPLLALLTQTVRAVGAPRDAAVCALLAWVAYAQGDGGLANVALDRALTSDPDYSLALLLREMLDRQVPPLEVRRLLRATSRPKSGRSRSRKR